MLGKMLGLNREIPSGRFLILTLVQVLAIAVSLFSLDLAALENADELTSAKSLIKAEASLSPYQIEPGQGARLKIQFHLEKNHHAYLDMFQASIQSPAFKLGELESENSIEFFDKFSDKKRIGFKDSGTLFANVEAPSQWQDTQGELIFSLRFQICSEKICYLPESIILTAGFESLSSKDVASAKKDSSSFSLTKSLNDALGSQNYLLILIVLFLAGVVTSFTPCVFPLIPITVAIFGAQGKSVRKSRSFFLSLTYVLGIALTYSFLGLMAARTGALFGAFLGNPWVVAAIACIFATMALSMFGAFEMQAPAWIRNRIAQTNFEPGFIGAFFSGLVTGIVASPCVGPVLVVLLAFVAKTQDPVAGFWYLFVYAFGFGQLFLGVGTFSHWIHRLPRSGPWMVEIKNFFGLIMILMALFYIRPLLKVELYVLSSTLLLLALSIVLAIHPLKYNLKQVRLGSLFKDKFVRKAGYRLLLWIGVSVMGIVLTLPEGISSITAYLRNPVPSIQGANSTNQKVPWVKYSEKVLQDAKSRGQPVIIDFWADWCGACKELEAYTFSHPSVREKSRNVVWVKFDATLESAEFESLQKKFGILGLPTIVFLSPDGVWRQDLTLTGFEPAEPFLLRLQKFLHP